MNHQVGPSVIRWNRSVLSASVVFMVGSVIILNTFFGSLLLKELFYCWLLVFINAYIGTFIANRALKSQSTGFLVWGMLINGFRIGVFVIVLLVILKSNFLSSREFASITVFGYLVFLAREVYSLHTHSLRVYKNEQCN
jgi:hypothetical protein